MAKRRPNYRQVKIHRSYSVEEIASLFGTHKNTVRAWVKAGLPTSDGKRPMLILGVDLAAFLRLAGQNTNRRASQTSSTASGAARQRLPLAGWWTGCL